MISVFSDLQEYCALNSSSCLQDLQLPSRKSHTGNIGGWKELTLLKTWPQNTDMGNASQRVRQFLAIHLIQLVLIYKGNSSHPRICNANWA